MTTTRETRPGISLLEVLVAIFIVAIGLLALLTLFPLGALRMGQALKDDRTRAAALSADGILRAYWRNNIIPATTARDEPLFRALSEPNPPPNAPWWPANQRPFVPPVGATPTTYPVIAASDKGPSYPVLIDPLGLFARLPGYPEQYWVAHPGIPPSALIPRRNLSMTINKGTYQTAAIQTCCLIDDFSFQTNGSAGAGGLTRQGRYSWAAMVQRPSNDAQTSATLHILVFDGRPPLLATPGDEVVTIPLTPDTLTPAKLIPDSRTVVLSVPNRGTDQTPLVRKGGWIMDGTIDNGNGIRHANFYRVVGVTNIGPDPGNANNTVFALDLETPIKRNDGKIDPFPQTPNAFPRIYLFAGLAEVFERPPLVPDPTQ